MCMQERRRHRPAGRCRGGGVFLGVIGRALLAWALLGSGAGGVAGAASPPHPAPGFTLDGGVTYTNHVVPRGPWSIHIVRWPRYGGRFRFHTTHAGGGAVGLAVLSEQLGQLDRVRGRPVAAVNGDFYQAVRAYAGDPRGLQIAGGELISAPVPGAPALWMGERGVPRLGWVVPAFRVTWPDGRETPFGFNEERGTEAAVVYTPSVGVSTRTRRGRELVLEWRGEGSWLPLRAGRAYQARVREVFETGDTAIGTNTMVLSLGPGVVAEVPRVEPGDELRLTTDTSPNLRAATAAIGGGPVLVHQGKVQRLEAPEEEEDYQFSSMRERHPRTAVGWGRDEMFLLAVDGRWKGYSEGMTLGELAEYLAALGCEEAMNLDGGGSATLWCGGRIRNRPSDGEERPIANALVLMEVPGDR